MAIKYPPAPRASETVLSDTIVVKVVATAKRYTLHKRLLIHYSKYFGGALSGAFHESQDRIVALEDVETEVLDVFVDWIYEKILPERIHGSPSGRGPISLRLRTYVLADRLMVSELKRELFNVVFDRFLDGSKFPGYPGISFVFNNLPVKDPLPQLFVDAFCVNDGLQHYSEKKQPIGLLPGVPHEAFVHLFKKMHELKSLTGDEKKLDRKSYDI